MPAAALDLSGFLTAARLRAICPAADPDIIETIVTNAPSDFPKAGLTTPVAISHFIGQIAAETGGLGRLDENLYYTTPSRLIEVYGKALFPSLEVAKGYVKSPKKLANHVYAGVNGNTLPDDGWTYRGSGLIQLTGRGNFRDVGGLVEMKLEDDPELCRHPDSALAIALGYWRLKKISDVATGTADKDVEAVTKRINPRMLGLTDRKRFFRKALSVLVPPKALPKKAVKLQAALESALSASGSPARALTPAAVAEAAVGVARMPAAAPASTPESLSGVHWVALFPTSRSLDDLKTPFREAATAFVGAMRAGGATVSISATVRPAERAYLMHFAWMIGKENADPAGVPAMAGVPIRWDHGTLTASRKAARDMVAAYGIAFRPALKSRHTDALAVDMTISWSGTLDIRRKDGSAVSIATAPRNGTNSKLIAVGSGYGCIKLMSDPPHWSVDGH